MSTQGDDSDQWIHEIPPKIHRKDTAPDQKPPKNAKKASKESDGHTR
jgi:hypothetical protein